MKKAVRTVSRPRWLLLALAVAVAIVPALMISTGASAGKNDIGGPTNPAHPVIDANWIYPTTSTAGTHFIYKEAGQTAAPSTPPTATRAAAAPRTT